VNTKNMARSRIGLKLISIILAILLWIYIGNQGGATTSQSTEQVKLNYINLEDGLNISQAPEKVNVKMWGAQKESTNVRVYVDLEGLGAGTHILPVNVDTVTGAMFTSVDPQEIKVVLTRIEQRQLPIDYQISGTIPKGYELQEIVKTSEVCIITGEEDILDRVNRVVCPVNINNMTGLNSPRLRLKALDRQGNVINQGLKVIPEMVTVHIVVGQLLASQELAVNAKFKGSVAEGYRVKEVAIEPSQVSIISNKKISSDLSEITTNEIDLTGRKNSFSQEIELIAIPETRLFPTKVLVEVTIEKIPIEEADTVTPN
jgi:YbbR domain-containing protein